MSFCSRLRQRLSHKTALKVIQIFIIFLLARLRLNDLCFDTNWLQVDSPLQSFSKVVHNVDSRFAQRREIPKAFQSRSRCKSRRLTCNLHIGFHIVLNSSSKVRLPIIFNAIPPECSTRAMLSANSIDVQQCAERVESKLRLSWLRFRQISSCRGSRGEHTSVK